MHIQPPQRAACGLQAPTASADQPGNAIFYRILLPSKKVKNVKYIHGDAVNTVNTIPLPTLQ